MKSTTVATILSGLLVVGLAVLLLKRASPPPTRDSLNPTRAETPAPPTRRVNHFAAQTRETVDEPLTTEPSHTNLYGRCLSGDVPHVARERLDPFLAKHHRSAGALLGALRASGDDALLKEAKERFPDDPRVQFAAAFKTDSPEERQQWLEKFKASDPDNSLANYLLAGEHLKAGQIEIALQELGAAGGKAGFDNHLLDFVQNAEEAYHAAGYSDAEAKAIACSSALLPDMAKLKQVGVDLVDLAKRYDQTGDAASAQAVRDMAYRLGQRLDQPGQTTLIQELVGSAIERIVLNSMNPAAPFGSTGQTVQNQMDTLAAQRKALRELNASAEPILNSMPDADLIHFYERLKMYGEVAAMRWVVNQAPAQ